MSAFKSICLSVLSMAAIASHAIAGNEGSGGGNGVVCFDSLEVAAQIKRDRPEKGVYIEDKFIDRIISVESLDLHKLKLPKYGDNDEVIRTEVAKARPGETQNQYLSRLQKRIELVHPSFFKQVDSLKLAIKGFPHGLAPIDDVNSGEVLPPHCVRSTIIAQYDEGRTTYIAVDSRIYGLDESIFPIESRAAGLLHEKLYYFARKNTKALTSDAVQSLVGVVFSKNATYFDFATSASNAGFWQGHNDFLKLLYGELRESVRNEKLDGVFIKQNFKSGLDHGDIYRLKEKDAKAHVKKVLSLYERKHQQKLKDYPYITQEVKDTFETELSKILNDPSHVDVRCSTRIVLKTCEISYEPNLNRYAFPLQATIRELYKMEFPDADEL